MPKCIYCNKKIEDEPVYKVDERDVVCCCEACKEKAERFWQREKKYKHWYYLLLIGALILWGVSFFFGASQYVGGGAMILCGFVSILFPFGNHAMVTNLWGLEGAQKLCIMLGTIFVVMGILYVIQ